MVARIGALALGVILLVLGVGGFVPALVEVPPGFSGRGFNGLLFAMFPVDALRDLLHLGFGVWGVVAWPAAAAARSYCRSVAAVFAFLALLGALLPGLAAVAALLPLGGADIWLDLGLAATGATAGFAPMVALGRLGTGRSWW